MKKRFLALALCAALAASALSGCGKQTGSVIRLDPSNPVSLNVWHYYNGTQQMAFDALVSEFNATAGKEQGIYVEGYSLGSVSDLEKAITDSAAQVVGASPLPDIFSTYADTAYALQQQGLLLDLSSCFTEEDLAQYVDSYIQEGYFQEDGALYLFPVAKSTEVFMINATDWEPFAQATGTTTEELATTEGITAVAQRYYRWTDEQTPDIPNDGKAFYGRDSLSNFFLISMKQMGVDLFDVEKGQVTIRPDRDKIRRIWDNFYVPHINGWFLSLGKFRSDDVKTGEILAYTGSISSSTYFPSNVITDEGSYPIECLVLPAPVMEGGQNYSVQQGANMAVTKSTPQREYAACQFLKWFTSRENDLRFACESSYLPIRRDSSNVAALDQAIAERGLQIDQKTYDCLKCIMDSFDNTTFYSTKCFQHGYATRQVLDKHLAQKISADKAAIDGQVAAGISRAEAAAAYVTEEAFESWYQDFCAALEQAAHPNE